jgi:dTDP-4-dehydrorhamnose 3,5-epimerase
MVFTETKLKGAFIIDLERREDSRGFFARVFCQHEFQDHGLKPIIAQANVAFNHKKGTMRGMHFQFPRHVAQFWISSSISGQRARPICNM